MIQLLWQATRRTDPEKGIAVMKNNEASTTLVNGDLAVMHTGAADADLGNAVKASAATLNLTTCVGIVSGKDIAPGEYGFIQCYGYHSSVRAVTDGTTAFALGTPVISAAAVKSVGAGVVGDSPISVIGFALSTQAISLTGTIKMFIRAM